MLKALEPPPIDIAVAAMLDWFHAEGGELAGAEVQPVDGQPALVATRDLAQGDIVMKVPPHLVLTRDVARHSPIGLRLVGAGVTDELAYFAAFLAEERLRPGHWRPFIEAAPQDHPHLPECHDRADWDLLRGSSVQALAKERRQRMLDRFRDIKDLMPWPRRIALRDFAWAWHLADQQRLKLGDETSPQWTLVPLTGLLARLPDANCSHHAGAGGVELRVDCAIAAGSVLSLGTGGLHGATLLACRGLAEEDDAHDTASLRFELGAQHWLHRYAPGVTGDKACPAFVVGLDTDAPPARGLLSFLRLWSLGSARAARAHPALAGADLRLAPVLDGANEREAMRRLHACCERALAAFASTVDEDDRLLNEGPLTPRQRRAVLVRRGEKRVLHRYLALARDVLAWPELVQACIRCDAGYDAASMSAQERALCEWACREGGHVGPVAFGREHGVRGVFATRDIEEGEVVIRIPRHLYLHVDTAMHSPVGVQLHPAGRMSSHGLLGALLATARREGGHWQPMIDAMPVSFADLPAFYSRGDWEMLQGTQVQQKARSAWKALLDEYRLLRRALPRDERPRLRDFAWGHMVSSTRAFGLTIDEAERTCIVPLADMLNHSKDPNCVWGGGSARRHFDIRAIRDVPRGTQLTIGYGKRGNAHMLARYGFCIADNPHDSVTLRYELEAGHWLHAFAPDLTEGKTMLELMLDADPLLDSGRKLFSFLRLVSLPDAQSARSLAAVPKHRVPMLDAANEAAALRRLAEGCERRLGALPCGIEEDDALLAGDTLTGNARNAVLVRRGEKRLLRDALHMARTALALLNGEPAEAARRGPWVKYFRQLAPLARSRGTTLS